MKVEKPTLILQKNAESKTNKIRIPKNVIETLGNKFFMEVYQEKIILKPINKRGE